ncbi:hypothetical protein KIN20_037371 [Parelaphostrongylus tenuis]|uniref:Uncharacterized protein n=1 Tax=Parelaphostrongylus tenuis TaxID=148309 RepID=A0AAD5REH8_PARTN|nr:hypothetical protein KIN20_037371 [Parelaphostrongylus tenuis]
MKSASTTTKTTSSTNLATAETAKEGINNGKSLGYIESPRLKGVTSDGVTEHGYPSTRQPPQN